MLLGDDLSSTYPRLFYVPLWIQWNRATIIVTVYTPYLDWTWINAVPGKHITLSTTDGMKIICRVIGAEHDNQHHHLFMPTWIYIIISDCNLQSEMYGIWSYLINFARVWHKIWFWSAQKELRAGNCGKLKKNNFSKNTFLDFFLIA